jgi:hypothetical protein
MDMYSCRRVQTSSTKTKQRYHQASKQHHLADWELVPSNNLVPSSNRVPHSNVAATPPTVQGLLPFSPALIMSTTMANGCQVAIKLSALINPLFAVMLAWRLVSETLQHGRPAPSFQFEVPIPFRHRQMELRHIPTTRRRRREACECSIYLLYGDPLL